MTHLTWITFFVAILSACHVASAERHLFAYETVVAARSLNDGHHQRQQLKLVTNEIGRPAVDLQAHHKSQWSRQQPSASSNSIQEHQRLATAASKAAGANTINGRPLSEQQRRQFEEAFVRSFAAHGGFRRGFLHPHGERADTRPRTVESPALSVDSGGRGGVSSRLANTISKVFHVEQGHYADIYDRIDNHKPLSTKRPAQLIDETLERIISPPSSAHDHQQQQKHRG